MIRNSMQPWFAGGLAVEPALDRWLGGALSGSRWNSEIDVEELDDRAELRLDVPGVKPEQINVSIENRTLTIQVERQGRGSFTRQYTISNKYDLAEMRAKLEYGVLTLTLPKGAEAQARTIAVEVGGS